jgi:hypothetical protein
MDTEIIETRKDLQFASITLSVMVLVGMMMWAVGILA